MVKSYEEIIQFEKQEDLGSDLRYESTIWYKCDINQAITKRLVKDLSKLNLSLVTINNLMNITKFNKQKILVIINHLVKVGALVFDHRDKKIGYYQINIKYDKPIDKNVR